MFRSLRLISAALPFIISSPSWAQSIAVAPDGTGTTITIDGNTYQIEGGTQAGANLFHSFQMLGLSTGEIADFLSNPSIRNIFGRVTGGEASAIDGLVQVTGANSNLYLMNPAGIVFGSGASLNVGGDFVATTSDRIQFSNGWFNTSGANDYVSLTGEPNQFAFLSETPGAILNFGALSTSQNISLMGGAVLNQGAIASTHGNVTLAAIPGERLVNISQPGMLLSLDVPTEAIAPNISPIDLSTLLTGSGRGRPPVVAPNLTGVSTGALPLQGDVAIAGSVSGQQIDLYAAGKVAPTNVDLIQGDARVIRFSETGENPGQAVFIDARADNPQQLLFGAEAGTIAQIIKREEDGIAVVTEQLTEISEAVGELDSVAIVAEGNKGNFWLGNQWIRSDDVANHAAQLQTWGEALSANADILLYSCFTALGATGEALVASMANLTGADVAASVDATGSTNYGANWDLETRIGNIEAENPFTASTLDSWQGKLANQTVTSVLDDNGAGVTLREAIAAVLTGDNITFAVSGQINLALGELSWSTENITIDGAGQNIAIDGGGLNRVFNIGANDVTLNNLTITGGSVVGTGGGINHTGTGTLTASNVTLSNNTASAGGGGIYSSGTVSLSNSTVENNVSALDGGGIRSGGGVTLTNSTVTGNAANGRGAGILSLGALTLHQSTVAGNAAISNGGGVFAGGTATLTETTIANNSTSDRGGGIFSEDALTLNRSTVSGNVASSYGGGLYTTRNITLANTTLSGNSAGDNGGGLYKTGVGVLNIYNSTIAFNTTSSNGGGIAINAVPGVPSRQILNSIVANNQDSGGGNSRDIYGDLTNTTVRSSVITSTFGITGLTLSDGVDGNIIGRDPLLGLLQNNGGTTETHALLTGSPALDAGNNNLVNETVDQTGNARIVNSVVDIGAYERPEDVTDSTLSTPNNSSTLQTLPDVPTACIAFGCPTNELTPIAQPTLPNTNPILEETAIAIDTLETVEAEMTQDYRDLTWDDILQIGALDEEVKIQEIAELIASETDTGFTVEAIADFIREGDWLDEAIALEEIITPDDLSGLTIPKIQITFTNVQDILQALQAEAGIQPALIYFTFSPRSTDQAQTTKTLLASTTTDSLNTVLDQNQDQDELKLILMTPESYPIVLPQPGVTRGQVMQQVRRFRRGLTSARGDRYLQPAQQLYDWLIRPLRSHIENLEIDNLAMIPDEGLRSLPVAALHDGDRFLVEDYSLGLLPSLSLIDWRYQSLDGSEVLAMGASEFTAQAPLPAVPLELEIIGRDRQTFLNERFTYENLDDEAQGRQFQILHLATHAQFRAGAADAAYIQLWDNETLQLKNLRDLGLYENPSLELLILSACETAIGDVDAELGFAGSALQAGVKSVLASLWQVSDLGTLALMNQFYAQLANPDIPIKAEALRQAQLALLHGEASLASGEIEGVPLPPELRRYANTDLRHPYYWSAFTLVGSPW